MAGLANLARMTSATTGAGTITLVAAVSGCLTFALACAAAGIASGSTVTYGVEDGANSEVGRGVWTAPGTLTRDTILASTNSNNAISLSGTAEVFIIAAAEDFTKQLISEVTTSGSAADVTFSSIPAIYRDLEIRLRRARGDTAAAETIVRLQFNADTGSNYDYQQHIGGDGSDANAEAQGAAFINTVQIPAATATASFVGGTIINILDYRGGGYKSVVSLGSQSFTTQRTLATSGQWRSASAITSVKILLSAGGFVDGMVASLYGHR